MQFFEVTEEAVSVERVQEKVVHPEAGAVCAFTGIVREFTQGKKTVFLEYQAYKSMAEKKLAQIGQEINEKWPGAKTAISHRTGSLQISDTAVVIAVAAPHRKEAFEACRFAIERIKEIVPIWKKEHWSNGESWIGNQQESISGIPKREEH